MSLSGPIQGWSFHGNEERLEDDLRSMLRESESRLESMGAFRTILNRHAQMQLNPDTAVPANTPFRSRMNMDWLHFGGDDEYTRLLEIDAEWVIANHEEYLPTE